jgi:predicted kinase
MTTEPTQPDLRKAGIGLAGAQNVAAALINLANAATQVGNYLTEQAHDWQGYVEALENAEPPTTPEEKTP